MREATAKETPTNTAETPVNSGGGSETVSIDPYEESMPVDPPTNDGGSA